MQISDQNYDEEPFAEVQLTALHNILANEQQLLSQSKPSVENADLKAQIQEKVFANAALNNELRKLKGNIVDSKFAKASILGKPPLQPSRNHLVVRQPNAFTSERPRISRPRESAAAKPHQDARKMTQDKTGIPSHKDMASTRAHCTPNACTPNLINIYRSSPVSKCSGGMSNVLSNSIGRSSRNSNLMNMLQMMSVHISSGLVLHLDVVWTKQFKPRSSSKDVWTKQFRPQRLHILDAGILTLLHGWFGDTVGQRLRRIVHIRWQKRIFLHLNLQDEMNRSFIAQNSYDGWERETSLKIYRINNRKNPIFPHSVIFRTQTSLGHSLQSQIPIIYIQLSGIL
ncbi:hypothetical protein Tco_0204332 [Tanacetum coccineum]